MTVFSLDGEDWSPSKEQGGEISRRVSALLDYIEEMAKKETEHKRELCVSHVAHKAITEEITKRRHERLREFHGEPA